MQDPEFRQLMGIVEVDETFVGGKDKNRHFLKNGVEHESVRHGQGEYVRGKVHTNNIESFWALLKPGVIGTYHHVSKKYLPLYLAEFQFRHNHRKNPDIFGIAIAGS